MTLQEPGRQPDPFRVGRVIVHDDVPVLALERPQVSVAIALEADDLGREICVAAPACEDRHAVAAPDGMAYQMRPDETRPAQHEHAQRHAPVLTSDGCAWARSPAATSAPPATAEAFKNSRRVLADDPLYCPSDRSAGMSILLPSRIAALGGARQ